jgi:uncharacterized glyoxalase superfamily protein PhnB
LDICRVFGFEVRLRIDGDDGKIIHSKLEYGGGLVMVGQEGEPDDARVWKRSMKSPKTLGGATTHEVGRVTRWAPPLGLACTWSNANFADGEC